MDRFIFVGGFVLISFVCPLIGATLVVLAILAVIFMGVYGLVGLVVHDEERAWDIAFKICVLLGTAACGLVYACRS